VYIFAFRLLFLLISTELQRKPRLPEDTTISQSQPSTTQASDEEKRSSQEDAQEAQGEPQKEEALRGRKKEVVPYIIN